MLKRIQPVPLVALLLLAAVVASLAIGDAMLTPSQVLDALMGRGDEFARMVVWDIRLPRTLVGIAVGSGLAASGAIMQAFFRNSLASPGLLGVSSGAALGAVGALALGNSAASVYIVPLASIAGAFLATSAVMLFARRGSSPEHMLLAGLALNAFFSAITSFIISLFAGQFHVSGQIIFWLMGGIENRSWEHVWMALPGILAACAMLIPLGRGMDLLSLGESSAQSLGVNVSRLRWQLIILSTILTALATSIAGIVGFVGLVVPHLVRLALGPGHKRLLILSMLGGAALLLLCDIPTRLAPAGLRLGVMTSLIGGPFLLWMLRGKPC
jgi:iron complex transport system permease protein